MAFLAGSDIAGWAPSLLIFVAVAMLAFMGWMRLAERSRVRRRFAAAGSTAPSEGAAVLDPSLVRSGTVIDVESFGIGETTKRELRAKLVGAGFFGKDAVTIFVLGKTLASVAVPLAVYAFLTRHAGGLHPVGKTVVLALAFLIAYSAADGWLARRKRRLEERFRFVFPDFLDLLVVCADAGLSLEAALQRVTLEMRDRERELHHNLLLMGAEMRAGRGTVDALKGFADRLGIEEARAMVVLLRQSLELGTDIALALRTYSDEMREKRASRAEEKAMALPAKLVVPLALFIFPVILIVIMAPLVIRIATAFK